MMSEGLKNNIALTYLDLRGNDSTLKRGIENADDKKRNRKPDRNRRSFCNG